MTINIGTLDRLFRAALGLALLYLAFLGDMPFFDARLYKYSAAVVGVVMLLTSALRMCPIYSMIGLKTCKEC